MSLNAMLQLHFTVIGLSVLFLIIRYLMLMSNSPRANSKGLKIPAHIFNLLIILSGLGLIHLTGYRPFSAGGGWLTEKLLFVVGYLVFDYLTLQRFNSKLMKSIMFILAIACLVIAAKLAVFKVVLFG